MKQLENLFTCANCKFFSIDPQDVRQGNCRRFPPKIIALPSRGGVSVNGMFPPVNAGAFCGEHKPKMELAQ